MWLYRVQFVQFVIHSSLVNFVRCNTFSFFYQVVTLIFVIFNYFQSEQWMNFTLNKRSKQIHLFSWIWNISWTMIHGRLAIYFTADSSGPSLWPGFNEPCESDRGSFCRKIWSPNFEASTWNFKWVFKEIIESPMENVIEFNLSEMKWRFIEMKSWDLQLK